MPLARLRPRTSRSPVHKHPHLSAQRQAGPFDVRAATGPLRLGSSAARGRESLLLPSSLLPCRSRARRGPRPQPAPQCPRHDRQNPSVARRSRRPRRLAPARLPVEVRLKRPEVQWMIRDLRTSRPERRLPGSASVDAGLVHEARLLGDSITFAAAPADRRIPAATILDLLGDLDSAGPVTSTGRPAAAVRVLSRGSIRPGRDHRSGRCSPGRQPVRDAQSASRCRALSKA